MLKSVDKTIHMADLPMQLPNEPTDAAGARARFFNSGNAFNIKLPPVPSRVFVDEPTMALAENTATGFVACDQAGAMACAFPATTPLMLARYATIEAGGTLVSDFAATGSVWYVIKGGGTTECNGELLRWGAGDVFVLPGGIAAVHHAAERAVLWLVSNEPQLAVDSVAPASPVTGPIEPVHYPAVEIERQIAIMSATRADETISGLALIFSSDRMAENRNIMPTLTLSLNTLPTGEHQRAHRHNSAAITLVLHGDDCFSMVDGRRCDWQPWATLVTPPGAPHSHHNNGNSRALFLIVQDGGLHYHARTMGFSFLE
ncbi:cupin domain-containing protein [Bradyrhizobium sp. LHD-71]|uniref:cupin domain-containing protein n=1 Tax=Bradyrhizobium sp. LHD-71 TaxID=3072141 RepID=UPI0028108B4F|nr:cupin domain-containing protein [Bradyrhizobium sp. LHD-71]MDQ8730341.1 cupin domain-containing protein [Bradyrhizobium sp. LHD-71]